MADERAAENCPFYPACYIAGDCEFEGWQTGKCGLPKPAPATAQAMTASPGELRALLLARAEGEK